MTLIPMIQEKKLSNYNNYFLLMNLFQGLWKYEMLTRNLRVAVFWLEKKCYMSVYVLVALRGLFPVLENVRCCRV